VKIQVVLETHSTTEDNESGIATGWFPGRLSAVGRQNAVELGNRRRDDGLEAIFVSDLRRATDTVEIAFEGSSIPVFRDWRLRECNYGRLNGSPSATVHGDRAAYVDQPYPDGESWREAIQRVGGVFEDLRRSPPGRRVLIVGHGATLLAASHFLGGVPLEEAILSKSEWRPGWEYELESSV
jgi:2,3-bisphosphoglycerate-dependent phosphoglycerate mutase